ncbi:MAG: hypothetical protein U0350_51605 [Caldilineaceae bacterium]
MKRTTRWSILLLILIGAAGLRLWRINSLPPGFYLDEAFEGLGALRILADPTYHPVFLSGYSNSLALNAYANALMFWLFQHFDSEAGPTAMRVTAACFGVLGVAALYALAVELQKFAQGRLSRWFPVWAAAALAVMRWHIHFSRIGIEPIIVPLLWASATWLLLRGWRTGEWFSFAGCGALVALSMYTYQAAWMIPLLMIPVTLLLLFQPTESEGLKFAGGSVRSALAFLQTRQGIGLIITAVVAFLLFIPFGLYTWRNHETALLRPTQVAAEVGTDSAETSTLWSGIWHTAAMYSPIGELGDQSPRRNIPGEPVLNNWQALLFFMGLGVALWRVRRLPYALGLIGLFGLLLPGALSNHAPHFHRTVGASAPTALLCAFGLDWLWQWGKTKADETLRGRWALVAQRFAWIGVLLLILGGATSTYDYFVRWATLPRLYYAFDTGLWQVGQQLAQLPPDQPVYLTPRTLDYPTLAFALRNRQPAPVRFNGQHLFPLTAQVSSKPEIYAVIEDEDKRTRLLLPEVFPTATLKSSIMDWEGKAYAHFYERPANAIPQRPPQVSRAKVLGDGIQLLGYDTSPTTIHPGEILYLQLHWLVTTQPKASWTVFTHLLAKDDAGNLKLVAGQDNPPGNNTFPTNRWLPGWRILDEYEIQLPADLPLGKYGLEIGLYQADGEHLPVQGTGLRLGSIKIK